MVVWVLDGVRILLGLESGSGGWFGGVEVVLEGLWFVGFLFCWGMVMMVLVGEGFVVMGIRVGAVGFLDRCSLWNSFVFTGGLS